MRFTKRIATLAVAACLSANAAAVEPTRFAPGTISDAREQWRVTFDSEGKTAWFAASDGFFPFTRKATIYTSRLVDNAWSKPEVAAFSGKFPDIDPVLTADGNTIFFSSIRTERGDIDLWRVDRDGEGWGEPVRLRDEVNSAGDELYPSVGPDGTLYFASGPSRPEPGKHYDIYEARADGNGFAQRVALGPAINTVPAETGGVQDAWEFNPEISADGKLLVFTSLRPGGHGLGDLYASTRVDCAWTPARNLGPAVNTAADEYHPTLSRDRSTLYFVRRDPEKGGDFFQIDAGAAGIDSSN